jgi:two-component system, sensor histidine kinase PdtaS
MHEIFEAGLEPTDTSSAPLSRDELRYRLRQQSLLGEFIAIRPATFGRFCSRPPNFALSDCRGSLLKVLEYEPNEDRLMLRAGVGWARGTIDAVSLAANIGSPAGYAYQTGASVISNHLETDTRFRMPKLLADQGIRRAINVLIEKGGEDKALFGVLEVDSADSVQFDQDDANFLARLRRPTWSVAIER